MPQARGHSLTDPSPPGCVRLFLWPTILLQLQQCIVLWAWRWWVAHMSKCLWRPSNLCAKLRGPRPQISSARRLCILNLSGFCFHVRVVSVPHCPASPHAKAAQPWILCSLLPPLAALLALLWVCARCAFKILKPDRDDKSWLHGTIVWQSILSPHHLWKLESEQLERCTVVVRASLVLYVLSNVLPKPSPLPLHCWTLQDEAITWRDLTCLSSIASFHLTDWCWQMSLHTSWNQTRKKTIGWGCLHLRHWSIFGVLDDLQGLHRKSNLWTRGCRVGWKSDQEAV